MSALSVKATDAIVAIGDAGRATAKQIGQNLGIVTALVVSGFVAQDGTIKTPGVGRPSNAYKLTRKGKGRYTKLKAA